MRLLLTLLLFLACAGAQAADAYDPQADAGAELTAALSRAQSPAGSHKPVLVIFGANWCPDCRALAKAMATPRTAELLRREFHVVKVDVGNFDRNMDIVARYGEPTRSGIPAAIVLSPANELRYATRTGELASARRMSDSGIHDFFSRLAKAPNGR